MTTLICSTCGDPIEVTATSVVLPFLCLKCEASIKNFETMVGETDTDKAVEAFYDAMTPASESDAGLLEPGTKTEVASPEDFATVENTTLLIEDLEKQLAEAQELATDRLKEIEYLDRRVASYRAQTARADEALDAAEETHELSIAFGRAIIARLSEALEIERNVTTFYKNTQDSVLKELALTKKDLERSGETRAGLEAELVSERSQCAGWQREWKLTSTLLSQELDKSLWTRFKEATFDRL